MIPARVYPLEITPMSAAALAKVTALQNIVAQAPQIDMPTQHVFHAGMYARTICLPAGCVLTGALIKIATLLIVSGDATVFTGADPVRLTGLHVVPASAGRKQAFIAHSDTHITMIFTTQAATVDAAEREFTDESDLLMSHHSRNEVIQGEPT
jgi:hypothetical protein